MQAVNQGMPGIGEREATRRVRPPSLVDAIIPLVTLAVLIAGSLLLFGLDALDGPIQVALILCVLTAALIALKNGHSWEEIEHAAQDSLASVASGVFILLAVGALIGVWNLVAIFAFKAHVFSENFWGGEPKTASALFDQVRATMLITVFVFLGIEGASVYSRYARRRQDVGKATVIGFLGVLALFAAVTIFSFGILSRAELEKLRQPSSSPSLVSSPGSWPWPLAPSPSRESRND